MANIIMQTSNLSIALRDIYSAVLIEAAAQQLIYDQIAEPWPEPGTEAGETVYKTIYKKHKATPGELPETTDPDSTPMSAYQVAIKVREHGDAIELSEKIRRLSYQPVVAERIAAVGDGMGQTVDMLAKYALMQGSHLWYANNRSSRADLQVGDSLTSGIVRKITRNLNRRNAQPYGGGLYLAFIHPDIHYDIMDDERWLNPHEYQDTYEIYRNEIGMWYGLRFVESTLAALPNAGTASVSTTLSADVAALATTFTVAATAGLAVGDVVTVSGGTVGVTDIEDENFDPEQEEVEIGSIEGNVCTIANKEFFQFGHSSGDAVVLGVDIHPVIAVGPGALARAYALMPELRVAPPTDKLQRLNSVGWYGLLGYGIQRDWQVEIVECAASV